MKLHVKTMLWKIINKTIPVRAEVMFTRTDWNLLFYLVLRYFKMTTFPLKSMDVTAEKQSSTQIRWCPFSRGKSTQIIRNGYICCLNPITTRTIRVFGIQIKLNLVVLDIFCLLLLWLCHNLKTWRQTFNVDTMRMTNMTRSPDLELTL